jgi:hypothetical protein
VRALGQEAFKPRFQFGHGIGSSNTKRIESVQTRFVRKRGFDRRTLFQKSRSAYVFEGRRPACVSARIARNDGRDFIRAYQFFVASSSFHGTSPK